MCEVIKKVPIKAQLKEAGNMDRSVLCITYGNVRTTPNKFPSCDSTTPNLGNNIPFLCLVIPLSDCVAQGTTILQTSDKVLTLKPYKRKTFSNLLGLH